MFSLTSRSSGTSVLQPTALRKERQKGAHSALFIHVMHFSVAIRSLLDCLGTLTVDLSTQQGSQAR